jgi:hypothetical protein
LLVEPLEDRWVPSTITPMALADGGQGSGSLRDAVLQFNADSGTDDDIIELLPGTYTLTIRNTHGHENAGLEGDLDLTQTSHRWIIEGAGSSTIVDASQLQDRVFQIVNPGTEVVFRNLVIQGGLAQDDGTEGALPGTTDALGGGILNNGGHVTLDHVVLENNVARGGDAASRGAAGHNARGGGFYSTGGALTMAGATIANNQAIGGRGGDYTGVLHGNGGLAGGGGLYATGGSLEIATSTIGSNRATGGPGGNGLITGTLTLYAGNGGTGQGGGLYVNGGSLTIASSTIASNQANGGPSGAVGSSGYSEGGGLYNGGMLTVSNSTLSGDSAISGGGINNMGTLTVTGSTLSGNSGGGIYNMGTLTVTGSTLSGNSSYSGSGIYNGGTLTVTGSTLSGNHADVLIGAGGGIFNQGTLTVDNCTLSGNSAGLFGGGIANRYGTLTVTGSTLSGNSSGGSGGGIDNLYGTMMVTGSTLSGNRAAENGGGIYSAIFAGASRVILTNVTLTANRANTGGGSYHGGGLCVNGSLVPILHNTLIAGNFNGATGTTRDDVYGPLDPGGDYNLIGDGTGMTGLQSGVNGNLVGSVAAPIDPLLGPLQNNGGPTLTHALLAGSPAIDAGNNAYAAAADQRGFARIVGDTIDIGAFEVQSAGQATHLRIQAPPSVSAGTPFTITVTALDDFGQPATGYTGAVHFVASNGAMATYTFTAADMGTHAFTNLVLRRAQTLTVTGTDASNDSVTGNTTFTITPAAADHLVFLQQPTNTAAGQTIGPPVLVAVVDAFGNVETGDNSDTVTLSVGANPGGGTLSGTLTLTVVNGVASFSDLSIDRAGTGYTLHAVVGGGLPGLDSNPFNITM